MHSNRRKKKEEEKEKDIVRTHKDELYCSFNVELTRHV